MSKPDYLKYDGRKPEPAYETGTDSPLDERDIRELLEAVIGLSSSHTRVRMERIAELACRSLRSEIEQTQSGHENAQDGHGDKRETPKVAFSIKTDGEHWFLHGEELVPGLNLLGKDLGVLLDDLIPAWKRLHEVAPQQVPAPPSVRSATVATAWPKAPEIDLLVDHYFSRTVGFMHAGCHDKIREAVQGIFQELRISSSDSGSESGATSTRSKE